MFSFLSKWPLVRQIRERKDGTGLKSMSDKTRAMRARQGTEGGAGLIKGKDCLWCATNCR